MEGESPGSDPRPRSPTRPPDEALPPGPSATHLSDWGLDLLAWLPEPACAAFARSARTRRFSPGETVYAIADPAREMFRVVSGMVRLAIWSADGREIVYGLLQAGDCFGAHDLVCGGRRTHAAEARNRVVVQALDRRAFAELRTDHRVFDEALLHLVTGELKLLATYFAAATFDEPPSFLARRLLDSAQRDRAQRLVVRLPQTELALLIGATRQTVNKILRTFENGGLVALGYGEVVIRDPAGLAALAERGRSELSAR